jgi:hypothetical protein
MRKVGKSMQTSTYKTNCLIGIAFVVLSLLNFSRTSFSAAKELSERLSDERITSERTFWYRITAELWFTALTDDMSASLQG